MLQYIREIIVTFVDNTRQRLELLEDQPALALFDHFKGQLTEGITAEFKVYCYDFIIFSALI